MRESINFFPDWASPPGATINDLLQERGQSVAEFARAMNNSVDHIEQLLNGTVQISNELADHLASVIGGSAQFWVSRETQFRDSLSRLAKNEEWLRGLPVNDLLRFKWIRNANSVAEKIEACLEYFDVPTVTDWHERYEGGARLAAFRTSSSFTSSEGATLAWLRKGEIDGAAMHCQEWNLERFQGVLPQIRSLTREKSPDVFIPKLQALCAGCGVAVVVARAPTGCRASGATRFISPDKAILMLSFRYLSDDHFWFTFFHEAGHLLLHDKSSLFLEDGGLCTGKEEHEANEFAANHLVPPEHQDEMRALPPNGRTVMRFARKIDIAPGIVVGQLHHLNIFARNQLNNLRVRYRWPEE